MNAIISLLPSYPPQKKKKKKRSNTKLYRKWSPVIKTVTQLYFLKSWAQERS